MLKIVGLGAGDLDLLTVKAYRILKETENLYLRTAHHPAVDDLVKEGIADFAVTEDSDLIAFGCPQTILKLSLN